MNPQAIQALIRRILRAVGVMLATRGVCSDEAWSLISGAILTIAMETWSFAVKVRAGDRGKELWVTFVQNSARAVSYVFVTRGTIGSEEAELYCGLVAGLVLEWWTLNEGAKRAEPKQEAKKEEGLT
jgi:hypothetical protein